MKISLMDCVTNTIIKMFAISHIRAVHGLKRTYKYEWPTWPKDNTRSSPFIKKLAANDWLKELGRRTDELHKMEVNFR